MEHLKDSIKYRNFNHSVCVFVKSHYIDEYKSGKLKIFTIMDFEPIKCVKICLHNTSNKKAQTIYVNFDYIKEDNYKIIFDVLNKNIFELLSED